MLEEIKKIQGITNDDFDKIIENFVESCKADLMAIGIAEKKVNNSDPDSLIHTAILTYVLSFLDIVNSEMYANSYCLQKDMLRRLSEYKKNE